MSHPAGMGSGVWRRPLIALTAAAAGLAFVLLLAVCLPDGQPAALDEGVRPGAPPLMAAYLH